LVFVGAAELEAPELEAPELCPPQLPSNLENPDFRESQGLNLEISKIPIFIKKSRLESRNLENLDFHEKIKA
jgi:hypothetical protein